MTDDVHKNLNIFGFYTIEVSRNCDQAKFDIRLRKELQIQIKIENIFLLRKTVVEASETIMFSLVNKCFQVYYFVRLRCDM